MQLGEEGGVVGEEEANEDAECLSIFDYLRRFLGRTLSRNSQRHS